MNQNWIVENLNNAFSTWNGKLTELWGLVTTSPQTFKGGAVWGVMQSLHNAMIGIGYALIVLFFAISLFKNTANFHELKRPEAAVHYLVRFVAAKTLVGYGMYIMVIHAGVKRALLIFFKGVGRHGDDGHGGPGIRQSADGLRCLVAVHAGHLDIHEHGVVVPGGFCTQKL